MTTLRILLAVLGVLSLGCRSAPRVGAFTDDAFYHVRGHYRARYVEAGSDDRALLPTSEWTLENFVADANGRPGTASLADRFWTSYTLELEGTRRRVLTRAELYDLRFIHRGDSTVIWTRTLPLSQTMRDTSLQVLARDFVDRTASGSAMSVDFSSTVEARSRRFGPRVLHEGPARVDGQEAYFIILEHVDLDRREADPDAGGDIVTLVFVRPGEHEWHADVWRGSTWPMVLLLGYASRPEHHEAHRAEFESLIRRIDIHAAPEAS